MAMRTRALPLSVVSTACAVTLALGSAAGGAQASDRASELPTQAQQGAMVIGRTMAANRVEVGGRALRLTDDGRFVFGIGRDQAEPVQVDITWFDGVRETVRIAVMPRDWPIERIDGVPPSTVDPPPTIAERIAREQARVSEARTLDDARSDYAQPFVWPVQGRISGRFGHQRIYNGIPKSPHSGMDIAAADGTPVMAPAGGVVSFADPGLYLTGGTVVIDHGAGISSNFLHLSRIDVQVGERVEQGQVFAAVGSTGRSTGPHLHWGMNWFSTRIDPLLVLDAAAATAATAP